MGSQTPQDTEIRLDQSDNMWQRRWTGFVKGTRVLTWGLVSIKFAMVWHTSIDSETSVAHKSQGWRWQVQAEMHCNIWYKPVLYGSVT